MTSKKHQKIMGELFQNKQAVMAEALNCSPGKISHAINGRQTLGPESIGILITKYNVDPEWYFNGADDEPFTLNNSRKGYSKNEEYLNLIERHSIAMEKIADYQSRELDSQKKEIERLRKYSDDAS